MANDRSSLDDSDFGTAGRDVTPLGGGGTTNIGGGTSGAPMGNANTQRSNTDPIDDITTTDLVGDSEMSDSAISDRDENKSANRSRR